MLHRFLARSHASAVVTLAEDEKRALLHVLDYVGAEADRMDDADPVTWSLHENAIDEMVETEGGPDELTSTQADAVWFLIKGVPWEETLDGDERAAMWRLRAKLG